MLTTNYKDELVGRELLCENLHRNGEVRPKLASPLKGGYTVHVDESDGHLLALGTWGYSNCGRKRYVSMTRTIEGKQTTLKLHRLILGAGKGQIVDHIDGDTLNNTRANLRIVTAQENARNAVKAGQSQFRFKGIAKRSKGWLARIWDGKTNVRLGVVATDVHAAYLYDMASLELHGEFGRRNFLPLVAGG